MKPDPKTLLKLSFAALLAFLWFHGVVSPVIDTTPGKFGLLIVTDDNDLASIDHRQVSAMQSTINRDYLDSHCDSGTDETTGKSRPDYRIIDKTSRLLQEDNKWSRVYKANPPTRFPWVYISNGKAGTQGDVRLDVKEQGDLYKKWGG